MTFTVKNVKTLISGAYTASLYENGKRIAVIEDDGRGGQPYIRPTSTTAYYMEQPRIVEALSMWGCVNLPAWYLTSHGQHEALGSSNWELAIGYLIEVAQNNKMAKPGRVLFRMPDGREATGPEQHPQVTAKGNLLWRDGDWVAA